MFQSRSRTVAGLAVLILVTATCDDFADVGDSAQLFDVNIVPQNWPQSLVLGASVDVSADVVDRDHPERKLEGLTVNWSSSDGTRLSVTRSGDYTAAVSGLNVGAAEVQLQAEGSAIRPATHGATIQVNAAGVALVEPTATDTLLRSVEEPLTLSARALNQSGGQVGNTGLTWRVGGDGALRVLSSNTIGDELLVESRIQGIDTVYVSLAACQGTCEQSVIVRVVQFPDTIWVAEDTFRMASLQEAVDLVVEGRDANGHDIVGGPNVTWSLVDEADSAIVALTPAGTATARSNGTAEVLATVTTGSETRTATAFVTVEQVIVGGRMSADQIVFESMGQRDTLTYTPVDAMDQPIELDFDVVWESTDSQVVEVQAVTGDSTRAESRPVGPGTAFIRALANGVAGDEVEVTVAPRVAEISVSPTGATMTSVGDSLALTVVATDADGFAVPGAVFTWTSSDTDVAVVGEDEVGSPVVVAVAEGSAQITAAVGEVEGTMTVTVDQVVVTLTVTPGLLVLIQDDEVTLAAEPLDARDNLAPNDMPTWASDNEAVATVDGAGHVVAVGQGTATITATAPSAVTATVDVTVEPSGVLAMDLADAPATYLQSAHVYVSRVFVPDTLLDGPERVILDTAFSADLLGLVDGVTERLGAVRVPVGAYTGAVLDVDSLVLRLQAQFTFGDGSLKRVIVPSPSGLPIRFPDELTVAADDTLRVVADFDLHQSVRFSELPPLVGGSVGSVVFEPVIRGVDLETGALVEGTLSTTSPDPAVVLETMTVFAVRDLGDGRVDTLGTRVKADGTYALHHVPAASYAIRVRPMPACHIAAPGVINVSVTASEVLVAQDFSIEPVTVDEIVVEGWEAPINALGHTRALSASAFEGETLLEGAAITWEALDPAIATVDSEGVVTAVANGMAWIKASSCGAEALVEVTVAQVAASIEITPEQPELRAGESVQLEAVLRDSADAVMDASTLEWSSSNTALADVDVTGLVSTYRSGSVVITATDAPSGVTGNVTVNIAIGVTTQIEVGDLLACALTGPGEVACWGGNPNGQLGTPGDGDWSGVHMPQTIPLPLDRQYAQLAVGTYHACVLDTEGDIWCWGEGWPGALGDGLFSDASTPVLVARPGGQVFTGVTAGAHFTCATTESTQAYCWGRADDGRLGNGDPNTNRGTPAPVQQFSGMDFVTIASGTDHACALTSGGQAYCWGYNGSSQLGNNSTAESHFPVAVTMPGGVTFDRLAAGPQHMCALTSAGNAYCWGSNWNGQVNVTLEGDQGVPVATQNADTFVALGLSSSTTCGVRANGTTLCWGSNWYAQMGEGTTDGSYTARPGASGLSLVSLSKSFWHAGTMCGITTQGEPYCWGSKGTTGLHGTGRSELTMLPMQTSLGGVVDLEKRENTTCALTDDNRLYCWEHLGWVANDWRNFTTPQQVPLPAGELIDRMALGQLHICVQTAGGDVYCRGNNQVGQLGDGTNSYGPDWVQVQAPEAITFSGLSAGWHHTCAMGSDGEPYCWGGNWDGQLGNGQTQHSNVPVKVLVPFAAGSFETLSVGRWHACATTAGQDLYCWGYGASGEMGNGASNESNSIPVRVEGGGLSFAQVDAGDQFTCALTTGGAAYCWGYGGNGELGNGEDWSNWDVPVAVQGAPVFESIHASDGVIGCGVDASGSASCWGGNWSGQMGDGTTDNRWTPAPALLGQTVAAVAGSWSTTCAIATSGSLWCTGHHDHGETGVGLRAYEMLPVRVGGSGSGFAVPVSARTVVSPAGAGSAPQPSLRELDRPSERPAPNTKTRPSGMGEPPEVRR